MIELAHPWFLTLVPAAAVAMWLGQRRSLAEMTPLQRRVCAAVRIVLLLLLALALAGLRLLLPSREVAVVFAVDDSASISPAARKQARDFVAASASAAGARDAAAVIGFARGAEVWQPLGPQARAAEAWPERVDRAGSDIGGALDFASAILPSAGARRVVLLSDGNDTADGATEAARRLAAAGIELWTVPLQNAAMPETLVERVDIPRRLKTGEPFDLTATLRSNVATPAKVKLYQNQFLLEQRDVELKPGANEFHARSLHAEGNFASFEVEVIAAQDTSVENNRATATASLRGQPRVLLIDPDERQLRPLAEALRSEKIEVETRAVAGLPRSLEDLQPFDLLMLSDVSALQLSRETMELYRRWVQDFGGGFVLLGGENSYSAGGYFRTPVEQMLPVRMEHEDRQDTPTVALLVVLDRSGSMTAQVQGQTKMSLANQGAIFAMQALQPRDHFGVLAVDTRAHTVTPLEPISAKESQEQKIASITAGGGGIYIYTSLAEAFQALRDVPARVKHLILFSDAADAEEKTAGEMGDGAATGGSSLDLAAAMLSAKITTSVVALGTEQDKDTAFLRQLAERGNGRFYLTSDATSLPQIFSTETMRVAQTSLIEEPFQAVPAGRSAILAGLDWPQSPLLLGYNTTKPKPTADVLLVTERGEPLLATWRYGLGHAAAFTSDAKPRWAAEWLAWPGFGKFWTQLVRALMRRGDAASFQVATQERGEHLTVTIDALTPEGAFRNRLPVQVHALHPDGASETQPATQEAPGAYRADFSLPAKSDAGPATTVFSVSSPELPDGGYVFGHTRSYPREFLSTETDEPLLRTLAEIGGGRFAAAAEDVFAAPERATPLRRDLSDALLIAALALLPLDIWLRRRSWSRA
jgi:Ca-activated chloride channel homolog